MVFTYETIRSRFHTDCTPQKGRARSAKVSCTQARALRQARVKAASLLAAISKLAIFPGPRRAGIPRTRSAADSLLDRLLHDAHMPMKSEAPATASGGAPTCREILYYQKKGYPIKQYLSVIDLRVE